MGDFSGCVEGRHMAKAGWKRLSLRSVTNSFIAGICYEASQEGGWREREAQPADLPLHLEGSGHCTRGHGAQCPYRAALGTTARSPAVPSGSSDTKFSRDYLMYRHQKARKPVAKEISRSRRRSGTAHSQHSTQNSEQLARAERRCLRHTKG